MAKNCVVSIIPLSPYQLPRPKSAGSTSNAPGGCLSKPMAMPRSYAPERMARSAIASALAPVAQPLATLTNSIPVSPRSATIVSALPAAWLPPNANCTSGHRRPASSSARRAATAPWSRPDSAWRPNGWMPAPTIATSLIVHSPVARRRECEGDGRGAVAVVRDDLDDQFHRRANAELGEIVQDQRSEE